MRILITGSRRTTPEEDAFIVRVARVVAAPALSDREPVTIVDGDCPFGGADTACRAWADQTPGVTSERHPAGWHSEGKAAGPKRNQRMVDAGADVCLAFPRPDSRGTWDCIRKAADAGIPVRIYPLGRQS